MMKIVVLLSCGLVAWAAGESPSTTPPPAAPECPNLTKEQLKKLEETRVHNFDPHIFQIGEFYEVVGPKLKPLADGSSNCVFRRVKLIDENRLSESFTMKNLNGNEKTIQLTYEKIKSGIYLLRKPDQTPVGRAYVMRAEIGIIAYFICSLQPAANGIVMAFGELMSRMGMAKPDDIWPEEKPLPKLTNIFVSEYAMTTTALQDHVNGVVKEIKEQISKDVPLFGRVQDNQKCQVKTS